MQVNMYDYNSASETGLASKHITIGFAELLTQAEKSIWPGNDVSTLIKRKLVCCIGKLFLDREYLIGRTLWCWKVVFDDCKDLRGPTRGIEPSRKQQYSIASTGHMQMFETLDI